MAELTSEKLKEFASTVGVDVLGVGPVERFEGAPPGRHPRDLYPDVQSVITLGFRITRGSLRGIEEGTDWSAYTFMSYGGIVMMYSLIAKREISLFIEDHGYESVPFIHTCAKLAGEPVALGKPKPDVLLNERILAAACGLGEIGYSRMFLSPRFGPAIRVFPILTDAVLEPDPMQETRVCDQCKLCVKECPGAAISGDETETLTVAGQTYEMAKMDMIKCGWVHHGGMSAVSPFTPEDVELDEGEGSLYNEKLLDIPYVKSQDRFMRHMSICGAAGCVRACLIHLEETGAISQQFKSPFRRRKPWWPLAPMAD